MEECSSFWETVQFLQERNILCDIQLTINAVDDTSIVVHSINVHKLILVSHSKYFQNLIQSGDLCDVYSFVGVSKENLQLVVDYIYRKLSWEELNKVPGAAAAASAIQIESRDQVQGYDKDIENCIPNLTKILDNKSDSPDATDCLPSALRKKSKQSGTGRTKKKVALTRIEKESFRETKSSVSKGSLTKENGGIFHNEMSTESWLPSRTSGRRRKSMNYKLMSEGKELSGDSGEDSDPNVPKNKDRNNETDARLISMDGSPLKRRRGRPPKPTLDNVHQKKNEVEGTTQEKGSTEESLEEPIPSLQQEIISPSQNINQDQNNQGQTDLGLNKRVEINSPSVNKRRRGRPPKPFPYNVQQVDKQNEVEGTTQEKGTTEEPLEDSMLSSQQEAIATLLNIVQDKKDQGQTDLCLSKTVEKISENKTQEDTSGHEVHSTLPNSQTSEEKHENEEEEMPGNTTGNPQEDLRQSAGTIGLPCDHCRRYFKSKHSLYLHKKRIHKLKGLVRCEICPERLDSETQLLDHMKKKHDTDYRCRECGLDYKSKEGYKLHWAKKHSGQELKFPCNECGKMFFKQTELRSHIHYKHSAVRDFPCDHCSRAFKTKAMLNRHVNTFHSTTRNFQCDVCNLSFKTKNDCKSHRQKHFREKNPLPKERIEKPKTYSDKLYQCSYCEKIFKSRSRQLVHENFQHKQKTDGNSFLCTLCGKKFPIKHYVMQHVKHCHSERIYSCPKCLQTFAQKVDVKRHFSIPGRCKGVPREPKPFVCPKCGKGFSLKGNLGKHLQQAGRCRGPSTRNPQVIVVVKQIGDALDENADTEQDTATTLVQQLVAGEETQEEYGTVVAETLAEGTTEVGEPSIVELAPGEENVTFQGIVNGQLVPLTLTRDGDQVQYQVVAEDFHEYTNVVDTDQSPVVTYGSTEELEGHHVHLVEEEIETPMEVVTPDQQVFSILKPDDHGLSQNTESAETGDVIQEVSELVIEGQVMLEGGDSEGGPTQVIEGYTADDSNPGFPTGDGNRLIIQGKSIIPVGGSGTTSEAIRIVSQTEGEVEEAGEVEEVVVPVELVAEEQCILQVETDLNMPDCDPGIS